MHYKLSTTLTAHTSDVRGLSSPTDDLLFSASRDGSAITWQRSSSNSAEFHPSSVLKAGVLYVNTVTYIPPSLQAPTGYVVTGGQDTVINVFSLPTLEGKDPDYTLVGHTANVCALDVTSGGAIISGSWDKTARVWKDFLLAYELKAHQLSVLAVLALDEEKVLTGSADKTIKLWHKNKVLQTFTWHKDAVRGLAKVSDVEFASCSNDSEVRVWSLDGILIHMLSGHTSFVYSLSVLPNGNVISSGEDRTLRIWENGKCSQVIVHPAISVWAVSTMPNGDIISGSSDGVLRIFSCDQDRWADPKALKDFDEAVANQQFPSQQVGDVKANDLPGLEALANPGRKSGEVKMIHNGLSIEAHQWVSANSSWQKIGDVVDAIGQKRKQLFNGMEYDYVFDVDIQEGVPPLKLPYNVSENPYSAAQKFLQSNNLPLTYIDEVVKFIQTNTSGVGIKSDNEEFVDPFTGASRYRNSTTSEANSPVPIPSSKIIPASSFVTFKQANVLAMQTKLHQFDEALRSDISTASLAIYTKESALIEEIFFYLSETLSTGQFPKMVLDAKHIKTIIQILERWPSSQLFPVIDLSRLLTGFCFNAFETSDIRGRFLGVLLRALDWKSSWSTSLSKPRETNILLLFRTLANMIQEDTSLDDAWVVEMFEALDFVHFPSLNKAQGIALSSISFNISCSSLRKPPKQDLLDRQMTLLLRLLQPGLENSEAAYRALVGLGNMLLISEDNLTLKEAIHKDIQRCIQELTVSFPESRIINVVAEITALL